MEKNLKIKNDSSLSHFDETGGDIQEWSSVKKERLTGEKQNPKGIGKEMVLSKELLEEIREQNTNVINPEIYESFPELLSGVLEYAETELDRSIESLNQIRRYSYLMSDKDKNIFPIDFFDLNYTQYKLHMNHYKKNNFNKDTGKNFYGLKHRKDTMDVFNQAKGYPKEIFPYKLPKQPKSGRKFYPNPYTVHEMIHYENYHKDNEINKWLQYAFFYGFFIGPRPPKEMCLQKVSDIHIDDGYMDIVESKVYGTIRTIYPEKVILKGKTRKSIANYINKIRPKFTTQYSDDYLFVSYNDGKPYNTDKRIRTFGKTLNQYGKMVDSRFHCYCMRDFCAVSRLIHAWYINDPDPLEYVENYLGHEEQSTTERYSRPARNLHRIHKFDWIPRVLKMPKKLYEENTLKSKQRKKTFVSSGIITRRKYGPAEI